VRENKILQVAMIENVIAHYRIDFLRRLAQLPDINLTLFHGDASGTTSLKKIEAVPGLKMVKVRSVGNERYLIWQFLPPSLLSKKWDVVMYYSNPRYLSTVLSASARSLLGKSTILRNHYQTAGQPRTSERVRLYWTRKFSNHMVYTRTEVERMKSDGFDRHKIEGWGNGLDSEAIDEIRQAWTVERINRWQLTNIPANSRVLLSVGRLINRNNFDHVIEALESTAALSRFRWHIIGDGPELEPLREKVKRSGLSDRVWFAGPIHDEEELAPHFLSAAALVHPGAIGLAMIHAFNYGLPVVTHSNSRFHMPEFAAAKQGFNSELFHYGDRKDLAKAIERLATGEQFDRTQIIRDVRERFSTRIMAERTADFIRQVANPSQLENG
jgi:glycosyltransferase involved in cell wall biosynthesis